jgi:hypothetical protein
MKLLLENWNKFLNEQVGRDNFSCPPNEGYGTEYYFIDRNNPPTIEQISKCWVRSERQINDDSVNYRKPAFYPTAELARFREWTKEKLRRLKPDSSLSYDQLKADIEQSGIKEALTVYVGLDGRVKIGEGNHRHQIAIEIGLKTVPVRFVFARKVRRGIMVTEAAK